ncbi:uncharacterized protein L969DRAFT_94565 [Mixia osmundae IAM 14324]|uniref:Uncharacterized protein n=1 Tax=Mixia osmundae (strain CBS 9802 / IAM 14324 / JCM 22182 / KY 12970) TaxID=764103 RepID=G7E0W7_MIXOS|nr:uncharacterized protein L969DRAFT_94565 [Mixia osmundae IAM 14324]KEI39507.1 hypothetical protein L969DRAFT_94565 [Mixia osmundae IAM 14324]GAA96477.1 hypothetical protein E5Q_03145 [Mixia osmundae IAM 14324]
MGKRARATQKRSEMINDYPGMASSGQSNLARGDRSSTLAGETDRRKCCLTGRKER